jgi:hypothetical protein
MADENASRVVQDPLTGIIRLIYTRTEPLDAVMRLVDSIIEIYAETGENRLLIDTRSLQTHDSIPGVYERTGFMARKLRMPQLVVLDVISCLVDRIIEIQADSDWNVARVIKGSKTSENRPLFDACAPKVAESKKEDGNHNNLGVFKTSGKGIRIAFLFNANVSANFTRFVENVFQNRGLEATIQPDEESAILWLGDKD